MNQFDLFGIPTTPAAPIAPAPSDRPKVYQNMDRAREEYGHLIGLPATWTREVKTRSIDGLVIAQEPGSGWVVGVSGGIDKYSPRLIVHECDCCKTYDPKAVCARGKGTWWVEPERVSVGGIRASEARK